MLIGRSPSAVVRCVGVVSQEFESNSSRCPSYEAAERLRRTGLAIHEMETVLLTRGYTPREAKPPVLLAEGVSRTYLIGGSEVYALKDVSLSVARGEFLALSGPSGSGKSTLLNLLGGLERPTAGRVAICSKEISGLSLSDLADFRAREIGFVFQNFNLIPVLNAVENVEYPLTLRKMSRSERRRRAMEALDAVGLSERSRHRPSELSGGQQQRLAIARAVVSEPSIVLADEPTANLDSRSGDEILGLMSRLNRERGATIVFSTHDPRVLALARRVVQLSDGRIIEDS